MKTYKQKLQETRKLIEKWLANPNLKGRRLLYSMYCNARRNWDEPKLQAMWFALEIYEYCGDKGVHESSCLCYLNSYFLDLEYKAKRDLYSIDELKNIVTSLLSGYSDKARLDGFWENADKKWDDNRSKCYWVAFLIDCMDCHCGVPAKDLLYSTYDFFENK